MVQIGPKRGPREPGECVPSLSSPLCVGRDVPFPLSNRARDRSQTGNRHPWGLSGASQGLHPLLFSSFSREREGKNKSKSHNSKGLCWPLSPLLPEKGGRRIGAQTCPIQAPHTSPRESNEWAPSLSSPPLVGRGFPSHLPNRARATAPRVCIGPCSPDSSDGGHSERPPDRLQTSPKRGPREPREWPPFPVIFPISGKGLSFRTFK